MTRARASEFEQYLDSISGFAYDTIFSERRNREYRKTDIALLAMQNVEQANAISGIIPASVAFLAGELDQSYPDITMRVGRIVGCYDHEEQRTIIGRDYFPWNTSLDCLLKSEPPRVVGLSVPLGTLAVARTVYDAIVASDKFADTGIILGGGIPTNAPQETLKEFPRAKLVCGYGEAAIKNVIDASRAGRFNDLPQIMTGNATVPPAVPLILKSKIFPANEPGFFAELSRGCLGRSCAFCNTGFRNGRRVSYIDKLPEYLAALDGNVDKDRYAVRAWEGPFDGGPSEEPIGISMFDLTRNRDNRRVIDFLDEDFLGTDQEVSKFIEIMEKDRANGREIKFSTSMQIENIVPPDHGARERRCHQIKQLAALGLGNAFIGVESVVRSQLDRYNKHRGITVDDMCSAIDILESNGVGVDMGLIPFDPWSTPDELKEFAETMLKSGLAKRIHGMLNAKVGLRLEPGSLLTRRYMAETGEKLPFDLNTVSHQYEFKDKRVRDIYDWYMGSPFHSAEEAFEALLDYAS